MHAYVHMCVHTYISVHTCTLMYIYVCMQTYIQTDNSKYICINMYTYIHSYKHIYMPNTQKTTHENICTYRRILHEFFNTHKYFREKLCILRNHTDV